MGSILPRRSICGGNGELGITTLFSSRCGAWFGRGSEKVRPCSVPVELSFSVILAWINNPLYRELAIEESPFARCGERILGRWRDPLETAGA